MVQKAAQGCGRNRDAQLGNVSFQEGPDEAFAPRAAVFIGAGEERARKSPAQPQAFGRIRAGFAHIEAGELDKLDPAGKAFRDSLDNLRRGTAENQKASLILRAVDQHPQDLEQLRHFLDLIENGDPLEGAEHQFGILQTAPIGLGFQIEIECRPALGKPAGQGCFPALPGAQQRRNG